MNSLQEAYYGCAVCPKAFKFTKHLAKHVEESHSKKDLQNKPYNEEVNKNIDNKVNKKYFVCQENFEKHQSIFQKTNVEPFFYYNGLNRLENGSASKNLDDSEVMNNFIVPKISIKPEKPLELGKPLEPELIMKYEEPFEFEEIVYTENHANFDKEFIVKDCAKGKNLSMFSCNICGKRFNQQRNLKRHNLIHTGEKPYQCKYCNRKIRHQSTFKRHERIHTGEKPYSCRYCQMNFKQKTNLDKHENIHFTKEQNVNKKKHSLKPLLL